MQKMKKVELAKYQFITVGITLFILKMFKAVSLNWLWVLSPFLIIIAVKLLFFAWGYFLYHRNK
jgi:hypothetical protein